MLQDICTLAFDTRKAYYTAVAAEQTLRHAAQVLSAADAGAELARRQRQAGNWTELQQAREQAFDADAVLGRVRAEQAQAESREQLTRLLGLGAPSADGDIRLPERLPDLPPLLRGQPDTEQRAIDQRLDVEAARLASAQLAQRLGLTRATRFVNVLDIGAERNSHSDGAVERGLSIRFELPLFDWGTARVAKAQALYMQAVNRAAQTAIDARSEVRLAYRGYSSRFEIARRYRDEIVPLKQRISQQNLLRYNGMLIGVFELLADARSQIASVQESIVAWRDFWIAQAELDMALIGRPAPRRAPPAAALVAAPDAAADH